MAIVMRASTGQCRSCKPILGTVRPTACLPNIIKRKAIPVSPTTTSSWLPADRNRAYRYIADLLTKEITQMMRRDLLKQALLWSGAVAWRTECVAALDDPSGAGARWRGVNLGGWLALENWITPNVYR